MPFTLCVTRSKATLFHTFDHSGWWFMASATSATRVMLPNAALKSLHSYCLRSFPATSRHPGMRLRSLLISSSANLRAGMVHLLGNYFRPTIAYFAAPHQADPADSCASDIMNPQGCDAPASAPSSRLRPSPRPDQLSPHVVN